MSIIYDALKKTQGEVSPQPKPQEKTSQDNKESLPKPSTPKFKPGSFFMAIFLISIIFGFVYFMPVLKKIVKDTGIIQSVVSKIGVKSQAKTVKSAKQGPSKPLTMAERIISAPLANLIKSDSAVADSRFPSLNLQGIFASGEDSWVIINDQVLKKGDKIDNAEVLDILPHEVKLSFKGEGFSLILK